MGTKPGALIGFLKTKFFFVYTSAAITYFWGILAELSESVIIMVKWKDTLAMHYIAGIGTGISRSGGAFRFYNSGVRYRGKSIDGLQMSIWVFLDYLEAQGATPLLFIGVKGKKGWW